jgi:C1A family cysteine protease
MTELQVQDAIVGQAIPSAGTREESVDVGAPRGMGWLRDLPDYRDYTADHAQIQPQLDAIGVAHPENASPASSVDLRAYCSPVEDQGALGSCTANATAGLVEYFERRARGKYVDASRLFLYKATRNLLHWTGDTGAYLRSTMGALALFGVPPEEYWPYDIANFDNEPTAFCYAFASDFRAISYYRLDPPGTTTASLLARIKSNLGGGLPSVFGFTVYSSVSQAAATGQIPFPAPGESTVGGHAVLAVGYDDTLRIVNGPVTTTGALLIRNSWGPNWGDHGYGYLPYDYVNRSLAVDFWSMTNQAWTDTGMFGP